MKDAIEQLSIFPSKEWEDIALKLEERSNNQKSFSDKDLRKTLRLSPNLVLRVEELCKIYEVSFSTMLRALLMKSLNEIDDEKTHPT